jgi:glycosyltransferase involved in cell wall biosynthesis
LKKIVVLLSTFNGAKYLKEQLDSLENQKYKNFEIIARDDGSSDNTIEILNSYNIKILRAKNNLGAKKSFAELLNYAINNSNSEYFMFCDQDDVWREDKIKKTLSKMQDMEKQYPKIPILIHTDLEVVDENLQTISNSMWKYEHINPIFNSLNRLLIHNTITGCTMMINRKLAKKSLPIPNQSIMHDWWIGLVASYFGKIAFLEDKTIKYRQHNKNDTGAKKYSYINIFIKAYNMVFSNELYIKHLKKNITQSKLFLNLYESELDNDSKNILKEFSNIENSSFIHKRVVIMKYGLLKYGLIRNIGLLLRI